MNKAEKIIFVCCLIGVAIVSLLVGGLIGHSNTQIEYVDVVEYIEQHGEPEIEPNYEIVKNEVINDSLVLHLRLNSGTEDYSYAIGIGYYKIVQSDPFTEKKEREYILDEIIYLDDNIYAGWSVYPVQATFKLDFDEYDTDEFQCETSYRGGIAWRGWLGEETISVYR